ncbi:MAG: chloride channel protein [Clostridia bacterium]|nr:chloride channel protein [Clostridia bacterium]
MKKQDAKKEYLLLLLGSVLIAVLCGGVGALFSYTLKLSNLAFEKFNWLIFLLPIGGILTVLLFNVLGLSGKNIHTVFLDVKNDGETPFLLSIAVFLGTAVTQLFGGSAGKEGAALQIGSGISSPIAHWLGLHRQNHKALLLCGMSAVFSSVFTTPLTALAFGLEIVYISRKFYFKAVLPLFISSFGAYGIARLLGVHPERFSYIPLPKFSASVFLKSATIVLICAVGCIAFCLAIHVVCLLFDKLFKKAYLRITIGGVLIILLTVLVGNTDYNGGGMAVIERVLKTGATVYWAFALKILFTSITNAAGFKGGEIVPALFVGATLGAAVGSLLGVSPIFAAALGMITLFSGSTKCTVAALMLGVELFGLQGAGYFALAAVLSRAVTAKIGLYTHGEN